MASYNNNEDAPHEPDGVALVWNMKYKKGTPEYIFHCQVRTAAACDEVVVAPMLKFVSSQLDAMKHDKASSGVFDFVCNLVALGVNAA